MGEGNDRETCVRVEVAGLLFFGSRDLHRCAADTALCYRTGAGRLFRNQSSSMSIGHRR